MCRRKKGDGVIGGDEMENRRTKDQERSRWMTRQNTGNRERSVNKMDRRRRRPARKQSCLIVDKEELNGRRKKKRDKRWRQRRVQKVL